jgi:Asp-tRNA(Asn)/Glu-tRNA(Gln) amidotransferase C subunit
MATESTTPAAAASVPATKPVRPDEEQFKKDLAKLEKEHKEALDKYVRTPSHRFSGACCCQLARN